MIQIKPRYIVECDICGKEMKDYEGISIFIDVAQIKFACRECAKKWDKEQDDYTGR